MGLGGDVFDVEVCGGVTGSDVGVVDVVVTTLQG